MRSFSVNKSLWSWVGALGALGALLFASGCKDDAFCFKDCDGKESTMSGAGGSGGSGSSNGGSGGTGGDCIFNCTTSSAGGAGGGCMVTNGGIEICDQLDNDCNGTVDDIPDLDLTKPQTCGTCDYSCYGLPTNWDPLTIQCTPSPNPGEKGTCSGQCDTDYHDLDGDGTCEYYCIQAAPDDTVCNSKDDDCDGKKDEDVDLCSDTANCGKCGANCVVLHGTPKCVNDGTMPCNTANTVCGIQKCDCNGPGDCWWDADGSMITGCEYQCDLTNGGVEVCDGLDNDCDGKIDSADDLSADPSVGGTCFGDPDGECATMAHAGVYQCLGGKVSCEGANVLKENDVLETCNNKDDDCDGVVDDNPTDAGSFCGVSNIAPCAYGTNTCVNGALVCVGAINPGTEVCNGIDDDCDGTADKTNGMPPADSVGACNVPVPPPAGATSPCMAGMKSCTGGVITCVGSKGPTGLTDGCGDDSNCDGVLTNQPNTMSDISNCGACGNNCYAGAVHSNWSCQNGACVYGGCQAGYYDLNNDQKCEYACAFVSAQEICNGNDDNCNGMVDEGVVAPSPTQVCGVSVSATTPECTTGVSVACQGGTWKCTFPAGVCSPNCASATEVCDAVDNDCDGVTNENVGNYGKACASDDANPVPGDGACRTTGTFVCNGPNATVCSAVKADCNNLPGGCTELCDGVDNDCDGSVDEVYTAKGTNAAFFVKPAVTKISATQWIYSYEASRPSATATDPGTGNGYQCSGVGCTGVPATPAGETVDKTKACSAQGKIPWFNVSPAEVEQTCQAMGGTVCSTTSWQATCTAGNACTWGYNPGGAACTSTYNGTKFCNLGPSFDFSGAVGGDQDGLLPTGSNLLQNCWADWSSFAAGPKVYDITGNLREVTRCQLDRAVCGTQSAAGIAACASNCCSATSTAVTQNVRVCGTTADQRRLSGQFCSANTDCCNTNDVCDNTGTCVNDVSGTKYCVNTGGPAQSCRARGVACTASNQCCGGEACTGNICGGEPVPYASYPLVGGAFNSGDVNGATCGFTFYRVADNFKLFDLGFRCCFGSDPTL